MLPWQAVGDCLHCRVEGATLELIDPEHPSFAWGRVAESVCQLCGRREDWETTVCAACGQAPTEDARSTHSCACGVMPEALVTAGIELSDEDAVRTALAMWAENEGMTATELCGSSLGSTVDEVVERLGRGEPIESSLHAVAFLFPGMAAGGSASEAPIEIEPVAAPAPRVAPPVDVLAPSRLLVSVMLADGAIVAGERAFVDRFLEAHGLPTLQPEDLRPWRPHEVGPIEDTTMARAALEAAVELMHLDGSLDGSELRIVRTFARVWGVPDTQIETWNRAYERRYAPPMSTVWRALSRWVT